MPNRDGPDHAQAQAAAGRTAMRLEANETIENALTLFGRDARTTVANAEQDIARRGLQDDVDPRSDRCVLDRTEDARE